MAALSDLFDPRRERRSGGERQDMSLPAHVFSSGWQCHTVELVEISARGFRAVHLDRIEANEPIRIAIPGLGPIDARVKWVRGRHFGAEFCRTKLPGNWSSTAYWYQNEPHAAFPDFPELELRFPR